MGDDKTTVETPATPEPVRAVVKPTLLDRATHRLMSMCLIDCTTEEVRDGRYFRKAQAIEREKASDEGAREALALAVRLEQGEQARRAIVQDKAKWLFTLAAGLLTVFSGMLIRRPTWFGVLGVILVALPLLFATLLLLRFFGVERRSTPAVDAALLAAVGKTAHLESLESQLLASSFNAGATDFLVDLYRAALRLAAVALCGVVALAVATVAAPTSNSLVEEIRGNPDLIRLLRGPEGPQGPQGTTGADGPVGPQGQTGSRGPVGACGCAPLDGG